MFINGALQPVDVFTDKLSGSIKTKVPFKIGQRHTTERAKDVSLQDLRLYGRTLKGPEAEQLAKSTKAADFLAKPADKRTPQEREELFDWWLVALDGSYRALNDKLAADPARRSDAEIARHHRPRDERAEDRADGVYSLPRRLRQAARSGESCDAERPAADARRFAAEPSRLRAMAVAARATAARPRHGQSLLAGNLRHRHRPDRAAISASPANCRAIPNCSIGLPIEFR